MLTIEIDETGAVFGDEGLGFGYHGIHADGWWTYELSLTETAGRLGAHTNALMPPLRARLAAASTLYERRALCQPLESWGAAATPAIPDPKHRPRASRSHRAAYRAVIETVKLLAEIGGDAAPAERALSRRICSGAATTDVYASGFPASSGVSALYQGRSCRYVSFMAGPRCSSMPYPGSPW